MMRSGGLGASVGMLVVAYWLWQKDSNVLALICLVLSVAGFVNEFVRMMS